MKKPIGAILWSLLLLSVHFSVLAQTTCSGVWGSPLVNQTFGQGDATNNWYGPLGTYAPGVTTSTTFVGATGPAGGQLSDGYSGLTKFPSVSGQGNWVSTPDHTGNPYGLMFLINAPSTAATVFFEYTMDNLCPNTTLKLAVWILNVNSASITSNPTYQYPNMTLRAVDPVTNAILGTAESGNVAADSTWHQYAVTFSNGSSSSVKLQLVNNSVGSGYGNDLAIDDITVQPCVPISKVLPKVDTLICYNAATLDFNAQILASPYNPTEYQWQYSTDAGATWQNQGAASTNSNYTFNAATATPGTYLIRYKAGPTGATSNNNCIAISDTSIVTVSAAPIPPVITYTDHYCTGEQQAPFTVVSGTNIKWYDAPTGGVGSTTDPVINTTTPGTYTWYASQTTPQGCESARIPVQITVTQMPVVDYTYTLGFACSSDTVHFTNTSQFAQSYYWEFNDGFNSTAVNPTHVYSNQGTYFVKLKATNLSCTDSVVKPIDILHPLQASFITSADTICVNGSVTFTNTSTARVIHNIDPSYHWSFGDGSTATQQNPTHTYIASGTYEVIMVIKDGVPCTDTFRRWIQVDSIPELYFTKSDTTVCTGQRITFAGYYTQSGLNTIKWNFGDTPDTVYNVNPVQHSYDQAGTYTITLNSDYRVCPDVSSTMSLTVNPLPVINLGPDTAICLDGKAIVLSDLINAGNADAAWLWSTGDTTSSILVKHHGLYSATVTIGQCSTTDEVIVNKDCYVDIPNSFTPNGDGANDYFFPRQLLSNGVASFVMTVYNRWGQKIFETQNPSGRGWDGKFNDKDQPVGVFIYDIKVVMKNQRMEHYTGNVTLLR